MDKSLRDRLARLAISPSDILLPRKGIDLMKWAVVACDQYTSQREYWHQAEVITTDSPSTLNLIFPECYLDDGDAVQRIRRINENMEAYISSGVFDCYPDCFILVERTSESGSRYGLMASLDLEQYSYAPSSRSLIRATEGTILSRIPPRKEIRRGAMLELPHIMVLLNDARRLVIEPLVAKRARLKCIYSTDLMLGGGHLKGYLVNDEADIEMIASGLEAIHSRLDPHNPLMYAMGDGNHSLATARSLYEDLKAEIGQEEARKSPSRYALVELENIFDPALCFEAIHRVFFNTDLERFESALSGNCEGFGKKDEASLDELCREVNSADGVCFGLIRGDQHTVYTLTRPRFALAASVIQACIDSCQLDVDYIHGTDVVESMAGRDGNLGIILPDISKESFFDAIIRDGAFPRKTFSIGHANEKRYYMEARRIR